MSYKNSAKIFLDKLYTYITNGINQGEVMIVAVIGSREFTNYKVLKNVLNNIEQITEIVSGGAKGTDALAERFASTNSIKTTIFYLKWDRYGKKAAIIRNKYIIDRCNLCVVFWNGKSKGTKNAVEYAMKLNKQITIHNIEQ